MNKRRKFFRFSRDLYLNMFVLDQKQQTQIANFKAKALDFSYGKFWVESPRQVTKGDIVGFELDGVAPGTTTRVGEVISCAPSKKSDYFELGLTVYP